MSGLRKLAARLTLSFVMGAFAGSANACFTYVEQNFSDISTAEIVFIGSVIDYQVITPEGSERGSLSDYALITFQVSETLKGNPLEEVQLYWRNSTIGIPDSLRGEGERIVAAVSSDAPNLPLRGPSGTMRGSMRPDLYSVLQAPCSSPFVFFKTSEMLLQVTNALKNPFVLQGRARPSPLNHEVCFWSVWIEGKLEEIETACPEEKQ